jgi:pSer/pThr/pTyr-binding forkhead associated (FHA) protein
MGRIGKLFNKNREQSEQDGSFSKVDEDPNTEIDHEEIEHQKPRIDQTLAQASDDKAQPFGLKFILESGEEHIFTALPIRIGRNEQNNIILSQDTVSSIHAMVYFDQLIQDVCILDLDSLNGLFIDRFPTRKNILNDGMKIYLGDAVLTFRDTGYINTL